MSTNKLIQKRKFQDLKLSNMYLFNAVFRDKESCKILVEILLNRSVDIVDVRVEDNIAVSSDVKFIRLDVFAMDNNITKYDFEAQAGNKNNLPKRSRYYQSLMDVASLEQGDDYEKLGETFVIFICNFDPFGQRKYRYTFVNRCEETGKLLEDGVTKIFFSTKGNDRENISDELYDFLNNFDKFSDEDNSNVTTEPVRKIFERVKRIKRNKKWEDGFMTVEEYIKDMARMDAEEMAADMAADMAHDMAIDMSNRNFVDCILESLNELGDIPDILKDEISVQKDMEILKKWNKLAIKAESIDDFLSKYQKI